MDHATPDPSTCGTLGPSVGAEAGDEFGSYRMDREKLVLWKGDSVVPVERPRRRSTRSGHDALGSLRRRGRGQAQGRG